MDAGRMPSGRSTRRLRITRPASGIEELFQQVLRHAQAVGGGGAHIIYRSDFPGQGCGWVAALADDSFGFQASQRYRSDAAEGDANFGGCSVSQTGEAHFGDSRSEEHTSELQS